MLGRMSARRHPCVLFRSSASFGGLSLREVEAVFDLEEGIEHCYQTISSWKDTFAVVQNNSPRTTLFGSPSMKISHG